ncbi:DNA polymerase eta [Melia azedarach]|uniref:DNA polymerase eta n=1 Tax=Melia azedarach TaxID=155640 RepID=A0ACC1WUP1_MELAZ|nr:DNA polymerase eta [Melia azedarach]
MPVARPESSGARIIAHIDMDCFYVQVEQRRQPQLRGLPTAVVQYNEWKGGALIAVSYEARKYGVKRSMRGDEAKEVCPQIELVQVPVSRGKADLSTYRNAGSEVVSVLSRRGRCERASIDEVYLDLTDAAEVMLAETPPESLEEVDEESLKSHVLGLESKDGTDAKATMKEWVCRGDADHRDKLLACGVLIVAELRMQVLKETEFTCSAGIAHNKMLAKLASGMNKPAQQTVVPFSSVKGLLDSLPVKKMKQLGGKLGTSLQCELGVNTVGDLLKFSEDKLQERYGVNTGTWLWNIARGISGEEVQARLLPKSHGSGKSFPGPRALKTVASVQQWLNQLCEELSERLCSDLEQNKRIARTLTLHASAFKSSDSDSFRKFPSKSCPLRYGTTKMQEDAFNLFQAGLREYLGLYGVKTQGSHCNGWRVTALSVSASKIVPMLSGTCSIMKYFKEDPSNSSLKQSPNNFIQDAEPSSPSGSESYSKLNSTELQHEFAGEAVCMERDMDGLGQQEVKANIWNEQDRSCATEKCIPQSFTQGATQLLSSGTESCSSLDQNKPHREVHREDSRMEHVKLNSNQHDQKRSTLKDKGTRSILNFFKSSNLSCSSQEQEHVETTQNTETKLALGDRCLELNQFQQLQGGLLAETATNSGGCSSDQVQQRSEAWNYKIDDIDPSVVDELPKEIQNEIRAWLRPNKRPNIVKQRSTIADYFLPSKTSLR